MIHFKDHFLAVIKAQGLYDVADPDYNSDDGDQYDKELFQENILTEENRLARFEMAMDAHDPVDPMRYQDMHDRIHVDEKWFFS